MNYKEYIGKRMVHVNFNHTTAEIENIVKYETGYWLVVSYIVELPPHCYDRFQIQREMCMISEEDLNHICLIDDTNRKE